MQQAFVKTMRQMDVAVSNLEQSFVGDVCIIITGKGGSSVHHTTLSCNRSWQVERMYECMEMHKYIRMITC